MPNRKLGPSALAVLIVLCVASPLAGCGALADRLSAGLRPTAPGYAAPPAGAPTETAAPDPAPALPPPSLGSPARDAPPSGAGLLFVQDGRVMQGDELGQGATEVVSFHKLTAWDLAGSHLALLQGELLYLVDLNRPALRSVRVAASGPVESASVTWGVSGTGVLHAAVVPDARSTTFGRKVELRPVDVHSGTVGEARTLADVSGATVLRYDDERSEVLLIPHGEDRSFGQVDVLDLAEGGLVTSLPARGEGLALLSADGSRLLTGRQGAAGAGLLIYHLAGQSWRAPQAWEAPMGTVPSSCAWSADGERIACLLRAQQGAAPQYAAAAGLWVLHSETMAATRVADGDEAAEVVSWLPERGRILLRRSVGGSDVGYAVIRADGGGWEPLELGADAKLLGWAAPRAAGAELKVASEPGAGWWAAYYDNATLSGDPVLVRQDASLAFDWGDSAPGAGLSADGFSARWLGSVHLGIGGTYAFTAHADDGVRVWVDGQPVIDAWEDSGPPPHTGELELGAGLHDLHVEYYDAQGPASLSLYWVAMAAAVVVDDLSPGFELGGGASAFYERKEGHAGHLYWTWNSRAERVNWARWYPRLEREGSYDVQVYVAERYHNTTRAMYTVFHDGLTDEVVVDQSACRGRWISLGSYRFAGGQAEYVELGDATGEDYATRLVGLDAVRFVPVGGTTGIAAP